MAHLEVAGDEVTVRLSNLEKVEALHRDVTFPRAAIRDARVVPKAMVEVRGLRLPGTAIPGVVIAGTFVTREVRTFAVCHGTGPGLVIDLVGGPFDRLVLTADDPELVLAGLR